MKSKIKVKNTFPHLLAAATNHPDCPEWLRSKIWNALDNNSNIPPDSADFYALMLKYSIVPNDVESIRSEVIDRSNSEVIQ